MRAEEGGLQGARRILVYGVTGSGKTTLAEQLSGITGIDWTAVDDVTWQPGWVQLPEDEQRRIFTELCAGDAWILDSAYGGWVDVVLRRAELVVGLDYPRWLSLARLLRRTVDSIIAWHFRSFPSKRRRLAGWEADPAMPAVLRLRSPREAKRWITGVAAECREVA
jgi:hypothetical protein